MSSPAASAATVQASAAVAIQGFAFQPQTTTIAPGDTITWTNKDGTTHTSTANDGSWNSGNLGPNQSFARTFTQTGTFEYVCLIHSTFMTGTVVVTSSVPVSPTASPSGSPTASATTSATAAPSSTSTAGPSTSPKVTITLPTNGGTIPGDSFTAHFTATGVTIVPADGSTSDGTGHFHLFVDRSISLTTAGEFARSPGIFHTASSSQIITGLVTGAHTLTLALGHGNHTPFSPTVQTSVTFTTEAPSNLVYLPAILHGSLAGW